MTPESASSRIYTDFSGLAKLKVSARAESPEAVKAVAKEFESTFVEMMLKSLRDASRGDGLMDNDASRMYQDMFDKQIAVDISERGDFGMAKVLETQLSKGQQKSVSKSDNDLQSDGLHTDQGQQVVATSGIASLIKAQAARTKQMPTVEAGVEGFGPSAQKPSSQDPFNLTGLRQDRPALNPVPERRAIPVRPIIDLRPEPRFISNTNTGIQRPVVNVDQQRVNEQNEKTIFNSPDEFIQTMRPHAERAAREIGVDPDLLIAQAALETGWGKKVIRHPDGSNSHNLFGIKASHGWKGDSVNVGSLEYRNGVVRKEVSAFRSYSSFTESFKDYVEFIKTQPRYENAINQAGNRKAYIRGLQSAGYATDPNYANKIMNILERKSLQSAWKGNA